MEEKRLPVHAEQEARKVLDELRATLYSIGDGVIVTDAACHITRVNPVAECLTGWSESEAFGKHLDTIFRVVDEKTRDEIKSPADEVLRKGKTVGMANDTLLIARDGTARPIADCGAPIFDEHGAIIGVVLVFHDQSTERAVQGALRESEELHRIIIENIMDPVFITDPDGEFTFVGPNIPRILGYSVEETQEMGHVSTLLGEGKNLFDSEELNRLGEISNIETVIVDKNGNNRNYLVTVRQVSIKGGTVLYICRDITGRKRSEEALIASERNYREIFNSINDAIVIHDMETGVILDVNKVMEKMWGYTREEALRVDVGTLSHGEPPYSQQDGERWVRKAATEGPQIFEWLARRKNGELFWLEVSLQAVVIAGQPRIMAVDRDISERKRAEEELRQTTEKRKELDFIVSHSPAVVFLWKAEANWPVEYVSENVRQFGYKSEDFYSGRVSFTSIVHPDDLQRVEAEVASFSRDPQCEQFAQEYRIVSPEGREFTLDDRTWIRRNQQGEITHYQGIALDITKRKQAEKEKEKLQEQLLQAQKMESLGRLAGGVAHDFNNMLGVILGYAELTLENVDPAHPLYSNLEQIQRAGQYAVGLTRQLLAFARKQTVEPKVLELNNAVADMLSMIRRMIGEDVDLSWLPGERLWPIKMDPGQVDQILANLCVNARDGIAGIGTITIETTNASFDVSDCVGHPGFVPGDYVQLTVSDDGRGMEKDVLHDIFDPFFTTKGLGKGTGLGLSTVYGIVKQNKGFIKVRSEPGKGTTFWIYLPRYSGKGEEVLTGISPREIASNQETILLVEDEPALLDLCKSMLERLGYLVLAAGTPNEAILLAEEYPGEIDLLITDVVMPEMNGRELCKRLLSFYPNLKRLFMSGYTADVIDLHGVLEEGVCFIHKPFSRKDLSLKVREALQSRRSSEKDP